MTFRAVLSTVLAIAVVPIVHAQEDGTPATSREQLSYSVGVQMGRFLEPGKDLIDMEVLQRAMQAVFDGETLMMTDTEIERFFRSFQTTAQENQQKALIEEGERFLAEKQAEEGVTITGSGLLYKVLTAGSGKTPVETDTVKVHYRGTLTDGTEFDSSYARGEPIEFALNRVIPGWTEGLQLMQEGATYEFYIPYSLAYGPQGSPPRIPPFATLVFQVELLEVK